MKVNFSLFSRVMMTLVLSVFAGANGMDKIFKETGKPYDKPNWNVPDEGFREGVNFAASIATEFSRGVESEIKAVFKNKAWLEVNQPCVVQETGQGRGGLFGGGWFYPLQAAIHMGAPFTTLTTILALGSPQSFIGYDPYKHILTKAITWETDPALLLSYIQALYNHGISPDTKTGATSSTESTLYDQCHNKSARECLDLFIADPNKLKTLHEALKKSRQWLIGASFKTQEEIDGFQKEVNKKVKKNLETLHKIKKVFDTIPVTATPSPALSTSPASTATPPPSITSASPTTAPALATDFQPKLSWHDKVSTWCTQSKPGLAKATTCIVVLAVVATAIKLFHNYIVGKQTDDPALIIITNKSGTPIIISYNKKSFIDLTSIKLEPEKIWHLDMNQVSPNLIVTAQGTAEDPLPIKLAHYKISAHQKNKSLYITIYRNTGLRYVWSGIPYTYTATWK